MEERTSSTKPAETDVPAAPKPEQRPQETQAVPFRTPFTRDYPILGYE